MLIENGDNMKFLVVDFFNLSMVACWMIIIVLILRLFLKRTPKVFNCILWCMVWIRMIIPACFETHLSMIPSIKTFDKRYLYENSYSFKINTGIEFFDYGINEALADKYFEGISVPMGALVTFFKIFTVIWIAGILIFVVLSVINYIKLWKSFKTSVILKDNIWQNDSIDSSFVFGLIKPKIYIPFETNEKDLEYLVKYEDVHAECFYNWTKLIAYIILIINWYNPLVWVAYKQFSNDLELYCDEKIIKKISKKQCNEYTKFLSEMLLNKSQYFAQKGSFLFGKNPFYFNEFNIRKRVDRISNYKKTNKFEIIVLIFIFIVIAFGFFTNPVPESNQSYLDNFARLYYFIYSLFV